MTAKKHITHTLSDAMGDRTVAMNISITATTHANLPEQPTDGLMEETDIRINGNDCDKGESYYLGHASTYRVKFCECVEWGINPFDVFDEVSMATADAGKYLLDVSTGEISPKIQEVLPEMFVGDIIVIDRMEIHPPFRGHRIGLAGLWFLSKYFLQEAGFYAIKPYPLQFEPSEHNIYKGQFRGSFKNAKHKLENYYGQLGYKSIPGSPYMCLDPKIRMPRLAQLEIHIPMDIVIDKQARIYLEPSPVKVASNI